AAIPPLPLHAALPIYLVGHDGSLDPGTDHDRGAEQRPGAGVEDRPPGGVAEGLADAPVAPRVAGPEPEAGQPAGDEERADEGDRSEEHTSELQSRENL